MYLTLIELYQELNTLIPNYKSNDNEESIEDYIFETIKSYEENSFYLNYIHEKGYEIHINKIVDKIINTNNDNHPLDELSRNKDSFGEKFWKDILEEMTYKMMNKNYSENLELKKLMFTDLLKVQKNNAKSNDNNENECYEKYNCNNNMIFKSKKNYIFCGVNAENKKGLFDEVKMKEKDKNKRDKSIEFYIDNFIEVTKT